MVNKKITKIKNTRKILKYTWIKVDFNHEYKSDKSYIITKRKIKKNREIIPNKIKFKFKIEYIQKYTKGKIIIRDIRELKMLNNSIIECINTFENQKNKL